MNRKRIIGYIGKTVSVVLIMGMVLSMTVLFVDRKSFRNTVKISFSVDDAVMDDVVINKGEVIQDVPRPSRDGFMFVGWYLDRELTRSIDLSLPIKTDLTLYAGFIRLASDLARSGSDIGIINCPKDISFYVETELPTDELAERTEIIDELTGEAVLFGVAVSGEGVLISANVNYIPGRTYTMKLPEGARLGDIEKYVGTVNFTVASENTYDAVYCSDIIEIPEMNPSASDVLHAYTEKDVSLGSTVLVGDKEKMLFKVTGVEKSDSGNCLLLGKLHADDISTLEVYTDLAISLTSGTLIPVSGVPVGTVERAEKLNELIGSVFLGTFDGTYSVPETVYDADGLRITVAESENGPFGERSDLITVEYVSEIVSNGEKRTLKLNSSIVISAHLNIYASKGAQESLLCDVSISQTSASKTSLELFDKNGVKTEPGDASELQSIIEHINYVTSQSLSKRIEAPLSNIELAVQGGELAASLFTRFFADIGLLADHVDTELRYGISERAGVRINGDGAVSYRTVNTAIGSFDGSVCGRVETAVGVEYGLSLNFAKSDIPLCDLSVQSLHNGKYTGYFSGSMVSGETDIEGDAYINLSSDGFVISGSNFENACASTRPALLLGDGVIVPSDVSYESDTYNVSGKVFDIRGILCEPIAAVTAAGTQTLYIPSLSEISVSFSGEYARSLIYDRESGSVTFDADILPDECDIMMEVYIPSDTMDGDIHRAIHRTVKLKYSSQSDTEKCTAAFMINGVLIAKKTVNAGEAPGFVDISNEILGMYSAPSFGDLWDKDPYLPISEDTEYELTANKLALTVAFITYSDGMWHTVYERTQIGDAPTSGRTRASLWTCIIPALGEVESGVKSPLKLTDSFLPFASTSEAVTEDAAFESAIGAFEYAKKNAVCIYVADYSGETFDIKYKVGVGDTSGVTEIKYEKNRLRDGVDVLLNEYSPETIYALLFSGWNVDSSSDHGARLTAKYESARFKVTYVDSDGTVISEEDVVIGEIPKSLSTVPVKNGKSGVWLSSVYVSFVDWTKYPSMTAVYRDTVITAYYGELCTVTIDCDGGTALYGELPDKITLVPGFFDFSTILPEMKKATDKVNSYTFNGWQELEIKENCVLKAPFTAVAHIYRIELDAKGGKIGDDSILVKECTYPELDALVSALLLQSIPEKAPTETLLYSFTEWKNVKTDKPYTVRYEAKYFDSERLYSVVLKAPDGGLFPCGESEILLSVPYKTEISGLDSAVYLARIPSDGDKVMAISAWLFGEEKLPLDTVISVTGDMVLTAEYTERDNTTFKVTLDAGEGFFGNGQKILVFEGKIGDLVPVPSVPSLDIEEGYISVFLGWDGEIPEVFTEDVTRRADYRKEKAVYTVTYYGLNSAIHAVYRVQYGDVIPVPDLPSAEGYTFIGWSGLPEDGIMGSSNLKVYAKHDRNVHTVSYYVDGELVDTETLYYGDKLLHRVYPYKPGHVFSGWDYPDLYYMPDRDLTVSGSFSKGRYDATYYYNGRVLGVITYTYGQTVTLPPLPQGATVWKSTDVEIVGENFVMPSGPIKLYTDSTGNTYTIDYTVDGKVISTGKYHFADTIAPPSVPNDPRFTGKWLYRPKSGGGDFTVSDYMPGMNLVAVPELKITNLLSGKDINSNGIDDYLDLVETARLYVNSRPIYESIYYSDTGYPTDWHGVCTDVIWRAYFGIGVSFKDLVDSDIAYCNTLGDDNPYLETQSSHAIDFRRVVNLKIYYERNATVLTKDTSDPTEWQPGDIVIFSPSHIGICSDKRDSEGLPYIIHHTYNRGAIESDELGKYSVGGYTVVGHYRINVEGIK